MTFPEGIVCSSPTSILADLYNADYPSKPPKCKYRPVMAALLPSDAYLQANSRPRCSTQTCTHPEPSVYLSLMKRNRGSPLLPSNRCAFVICSPSRHSQTRLFKILLGIQDLLDDPNVNDPAQSEAYTMFKWVYISTRSDQILDTKQCFLVQKWQSRIRVCLIHSLIFGKYSRLSSEKEFGAKQRRTYQNNLLLLMFAQRWFSQHILALLATTKPFFLFWASVMTVLCYSLYFSSPRCCLLWCEIPIYRWLNMQTRLGCRSELLKPFVSVK